MLVFMLLMLRVRVAVMVIVVVVVVTMTVLVVIVVSMRIAGLRGRTRRVSRAFIRPHLEVHAPHRFSYDWFRREPYSMELESIDFRLKVLQRHSRARGVPRGRVPRPSSGDGKNYERCVLIE